MNDLVDFWRRCDLDVAPFIHPDDVVHIESSSIAISLLAGHSAYVEHWTYGDDTDQSLHMALLPVPYQGNLSTADIFIVLLNPGLGLSDYQTQEDALHSAQLRKIIKQDMDGIDYPFLSLNPEHAWTGGFQWWEKKLRGIIRKVTVDRFGGRYHDALKAISSRLVAIELFPYHSRSFGAHGLMKTLPSSIAAQEFVRSLMPRAATKDITVVITRSIKAIGIEDHALVNHDPRLVRSASLGIETLGGRAILERLLRG